MTLVLELGFVPYSMQGLFDFLCYLFLSMLGVFKCTLYLFLFSFAGYLVIHFPVLVAFPSSYLF